MLENTVVPIKGNGGSTKWIVRGDFHITPSLRRRNYAIPNSLGGDGGSQMCGDSELCSYTQPFLCSIVSYTSHRLYHHKLRCSIFIFLSTFLPFYRLDVDQIFRLEAIMNQGGNNRFYITRPDLLAMTFIAQHIQNDPKRDSRLYKIIFVPRKLEICDYILENEGVYGYIEIFQWNLHLIPLDANLLSLERFESFKSLYIENDFTLLHSVAKSMILLEEIYGAIPVIHGKGDKAQLAWDLFLRLKEAMKLPTKNKEGGSAITEMIILDRQSDLVTPLCSQLTYEGILDDVIRVRSGYIHISKEITGKDQDVKVVVNAKDPVFGVIRSLHFSYVPTTLSAITRGLRTSYSAGKALSSIPELKNFVQKLPELTKKHDSLAVHTKVSEHITNKMKRQEFQRQLFFERAILEAVDKTQITDYIEECIQRQMPYHIPLRLICLMSTTNNGIKPKYFLNLKRAFLHSYGHKHLVTFYNLFKVGLLEHKEEEPAKPHPQKPKSTFKQLSKQLKLVPKDPVLHDVHKPQDMSYVYGGAYRPLSCSVVEYLVQHRSWKGLDDVVKNWPGHAFTHTDKNIFTTRDKIVLVYFIGGVTFSEFNALQNLGKRTNTTFVVATTNIINPVSLMESTTGNDIK